MVLLVMVPTTVGIAWFGPGLSRLFYGHPEAGRGLWPLAVGMTLSALEGIMETALNAFDRQVGNAVITLIDVPDAAGLHGGVHENAGIAGVRGGVFGGHRVRVRTPWGAAGA